MQGEMVLADTMVRSLLGLVQADSMTIPTVLQVVGEDTTSRKPLLRAEAATGRVDWRFGDGRSDDFQLLVEVKIASGFAKTQLQRYLEDEKLKRAKHGGVIALTRDESPLPREVTSHRRWLGVVRWKDLLPRLRLESDGAQSVDTMLWGALLDIVEGRGDLGTDSPTWHDLEHAAGELADRVRGRVARAALDELVPLVRSSLGYVRRASTRVGPRAWLTFSSEGWFLGVEIHGNQPVAVSAVVFLPAPPKTRRRNWEEAVRTCVNAGRRVERAHLQLRPIELSQDRPPHESAAATLRSYLEPLLAPILLPRFTAGLLGAGYARRSDLARFAEG